VNVMRSALECCHKGVGGSRRSSASRARARRYIRALSSSSTGRVWRGSAFGGVKGRSQLPGFVERYLGGEIKIDQMVSEVLPLDEINRAFDLLHEGKVIRSVIRF